MVNLGKLVKQSSGSLDFNKRNKSSFSTMRRKWTNCWAIQTTVPLVVLLILIKSQVESAVAPPPWSDPEKNPCANLPGGWQLLYWEPLKQCFKIFQLGYPCPETMELSPVPTNKKNTDLIAECRCPPGTAQSAVTNQCYPIFERGPCVNSQYFSPIQEVGSKRASGNHWGTCKIPRPCPDGMAFWPRDGKCYNIYTRGPCSKGKLLIVNDDNLAECKCENTGNLHTYFYLPEETCHEHYTRGPCHDQGKLFLPGGLCGCHSELPHYHEISDQCYEIDTPGPCPPGHVFTIPESEGGEFKYATCQCKEGYILWSDGICYRLYTRGPCGPNEFLVNSTACIKNVCGKGRLYFPDQKTCYRIGSQGPCSLHQVVIFDFTSRPSIDGISYNGICGCSGVLKNLDQKCGSSEADVAENTCESTPGMVELNGKCYKLYTRGPCGPGQWLEPLKSDVSDEMTSRARCQCRPGYTSYESKGGVMACYAPSVGLARYLNGRNHKSYKFQFRRFVPLVNDASPS